MGPICMRGRYERLVRSGVTSSLGEGGRGSARPHLVQVHDAHRNFPQTLSPVDIGLGRPGETTSTELGTDSVLERDVNEERPRCSDALANLEIYAER